jgi:chemotaxis signal transduction protein
LGYTHPTEGSPAARKLLVFGVSGRLCAFPVEAIREIVHVAATVPAPGQPSILEGFLNLHGQPTPIILLSRLLGFPEPEPSLYDSIIFIRAAGEAMGVIVNSLEGVIVIADSSLQPLPLNHSFNDSAEAQFTFEDRPVTLLACDRLLLDKERRCIAELADRARSRLQELSLDSLS